jgi:hypothetical protein
MSNRADYTSEEWKELLLAPVQTGIALMVSEKSGFFGTAQEALALYKSTNESAAKQYPNNALIQDLLSSESKEENKHIFQKVGMYIKDKAARQQVKPEAMQICDDVARILAQKASPNEAEEYKRWLLDVSEGVAKAATEEGKQISPAEAATMKEFDNALHTNPSSLAPGS